MASLHPIATGTFPATIPRPNNIGSDRPEVVVEVELDLPDLVGRPLDRKDVYWFQRYRGTTLTSWEECLGTRSPAD